MPLSLDGWSAALTAVGTEFDATVPTAAGVLQESALPDPGVIASVEKDTTR